MAFDKTMVTSFNMTLTYWKLAMIKINRIQETIEATFFGFDSEESAHNKDISEAQRIITFIRRDDFRNKFNSDIMSEQGNNLYNLVYQHAKETEETFAGAVDLL